MTGTHHIRYSATTHVGLKRQVNEDAILALPELGIWMVSDGMGGHEAGDYASRLIADAVATLPEGMSPKQTRQAVDDALQASHGLIRTEAARRGKGTIGATVVTFMVAEGHFLCFWAGDSRLYRFRHGESIELLTTDHSVVAAFVASGQMSWDEAELHPQSNTITRAIGVGEDLELDMIRGEILPGDRFLICSDGLTKYATFDILQRAMNHTPIEIVADKLLQIALDGGGGDNISVIVVDVI
jgi:serine/threonine protein phosphatase Stp1